MGADRLVRCHASVAIWTRVEAELALGLPARPLEKCPALVDLLLSNECRSSALVQYIAGVPVEVEPAVTVAIRLDLLCRSLRLRP
jgi:hypothetical protein